MEEAACKGVFPAPVSQAALLQLRAARGDLSVTVPTQTWALANRQFLPEQRPQQNPRGGPVHLFSPHLSFIIVLGTHLVLLHHRTSKRQPWKGLGDGLAGGEEQRRFRHCSKGDVDF